MMKDETLATMRTPAPYWRHTTPSKMLTAIALFASLPKVSGATRAAGPLLRTRHRLVNSISEMPTLPPTRTAVRISLDAKEQKMSNDVPSSADDRGVNDAPLNDDEDALQYSNNDNKSKEHAVGGTTKEDARNLGVVAVSLAAVFSAIIVSILALIWKHKTDKNQEDSSTEGLVSILRNKNTSPSSSERKVRFQLPDDNSQIMGHAVVASTESKERTKIGSNRKPERKVKIHVEQVLNPDDDLVKTEATEGAALTNAPKKLNREKSDSVPSPTNINDPETWVSRIMHPWLDSQFCCPDDDWDASKTRHKSTGSLFDQSTIATNNSFESTPSHLNETSSVTPMLPPFPTSSKLGSDDSTTDNFVTADEVNCDQQQTRQVLGIQNPHIDEDDGLVLEEITSQHQSSTPHPSLQEERYDSFSSGNGNISAWRRKSWVEVDVKRRHEDTMKEFEKNVFDEEFDVESYTSDYNGILGTGDGNFTSRWPLYEI